LSAYEKLEEALESQGLLVGWGPGSRAKCPGPNHHRGDERPSLSVSPGDDGKALVYCHAGCDTSDIIAALGLSWKDLFDEHDPVVATYVYTDANDSPLFRVLRTSRKRFWSQHYENGVWKQGLGEHPRVMYRLRDVAKGIQNSETIYLVEGEKDADNLSIRGYHGTTMLGGAGKWRSEYESQLRGAKLVVIADNDEVGKQAASKLRQLLQNVSSSVSIVLPKSGKDVTDHLNAGYDIKDLVPFNPDLDEFEPLDWTTYETTETKWLFKPYIPRGSRVLAYGAMGSLKSLWAMWVGAWLAKQQKRIAYFSLEMRPSDVAKRLHQLSPPREYFDVFTRLSLNNSTHTMLIVEQLKGYDLIVIDSWSAAHQGAQRNNDEVARLDNEVFQPIIDSTGASILILDNTGNPSITDAGKIRPDWARGASAKGDKMDVTLFFERPYDSNNYCTTLAVKKMRLDEQLPRPITIATPMDRIEFYEYKDATFGAPHWPDLRYNPQDLGDKDGNMDDEEVSMTASEKRKYARLLDAFTKPKKEEK